MNQNGLKQLLNKSLKILAELVLTTQRTHTIVSLNYFTFSMSCEGTGLEEDTLLIDLLKIKNKMDSMCNEFYSYYNFSHALT